MIGEFVGSMRGLCNLLLTANSQLDGPWRGRPWVWLGVLGIVLFAAVSLAERLMIP